MGISPAVQRADNQRRTQDSEINPGDRLEHGYQTAEKLDFSREQSLWSLLSAVSIFWRKNDQTRSSQRK